MGNWQPIDAAPKDGGRIVVFIPEGHSDRLTVAYWAGEAPAGGTAWYYGWQAPDEQCGGQTRVEPTHWHPLSDLPA